MKKKRSPRRYPEYATTKVPERRLVGEKNWGWRYPPEGGVCLWRTMWIDWFEEERRKPRGDTTLAQCFTWNYPPRRKRSALNFS